MTMNELWAGLTPDDIHIHPLQIKSEKGETVSQGRGYFVAMSGRFYGTFSKAEAEAFKYGATVILSELRNTE